MGWQKTQTTMPTTSTQLRAMEEGQFIVYSPDPDRNHNPAFVKDFYNYHQDQGQNEEGSVGADYNDLEHLPAS